jgi:hypothetical protein
MVLETNITNLPDSSPKWFTHIDLDGQERGTEATLHYLPVLEYDESLFTHVQFEQVDPRVTPSPKPDA